MTYHLWMCEEKFVTGVREEKKRELESGFWKRKFGASASRTYICEDTNGARNMRKVRRG